MRLPLLACLAGIAIVGTLTGCSTASSPSVASIASTSSASAPAAATTEPGAVCSLLPLDGANAVVGVVFTAAEDSVDPSTGDHVCTYGSSDGSSVAVLAMITAGRTTFEQLSTRGGSPTPIDQVGDRAVIDGDELDVQSGDHLFSVTSTGTSDLGLGNLVAIGSATAARLR